MAEEQIVQNMIRRLGQSQSERHAVELDDHFVDIDERGPKRLMEFAARLAPHLRYYRAADNSPAQQRLNIRWPRGSANQRRMCRPI